MTEKNIQLIVAYEGTRYFGWQKTRPNPSIEEELEKALYTLLRSTPILQAASRTDRGVHARGQVVNFITKKEVMPNQLAYSINCLLPADIRVLSCELKDLSFHPTLDAKAKQYRYSIRNGFAYYPEERHYCWHIPKPLHMESMQKAASYFIGEKDFSAFCNDLMKIGYTHTYRKVTKLDILEESRGKYLFIVEGNHFLYKMVRNMIGAIVYSGLGKIKPEEIKEALQSKLREFAWVTAPAHGLSLHEVYY